MNINAFKDSLPYLIKARIPALLIGHHGIGKTEGVRQFTVENKYKLQILNLGTQDVGDLIGLADFLKDAKGNNIATKFMIPDWAKEMYEFCSQNPDKIGVLFLDEINRAKRDVLQVIFPLLLEKRMHNLTFPENFYVLSAMNPNTDDYIVTDISDKALLDRFCHIKLAPSKQEFFEYAKKRGFDSGILQFLSEQPKMLQAELEAFDLEVKPSRRSWEHVDRLLKAKTPLNLLRELGNGLVGTVATTAFIKSLSDADKPISAKDILENFPELEKRIKAYSNAKTGGRMDMLKWTCDSIVEMAQTRKDKLSAPEAKNLTEFLVTIPKDLAYDLCRTIYLDDVTRPVIDESKELLKIFADTRKMKVEGINS